MTALIVLCLAASAASAWAVRRIRRATGLILAELRRQPGLCEWQLCLRADISGPVCRAALADLRESGLVQSQEPYEDGGEVYSLTAAGRELATWARYAQELGG